MIAARYASLLAFAQSRGADCGRDADGKFASGNKCAVEVADVPKPVAAIAPTVLGAAVGAAAGAPAGIPGMAIGGALGAVFGAVHAYFSKSSSQMAAEAQKAVGMTGKQVDATARALGASSKDKASGFVTARDAFGIWAPNDDIVIVTQSSPFGDDADQPSRSLHFEPTPETMRSGDVAGIALKAAKAAGAKTVTVSSRGPVSAKSLADAGFTEVAHNSQMMQWTETVVYKKSLVDKPASRAFCATGVGGGIKNDCSSSDGGGSGDDRVAKSFPSGSQNLRDAVDSVAPSPEAIWDRSKGRAETPPPKQIDEIAAEQGSHSGAPLTPEAEASYKSLVDEIGRQYEALTAAGLKARAWHGEDEPYGDPPGSTKPNSDRMREEVASTGEFNFFRTDSGFGTGDATPNHPMLRPTQYKTADGEPMVANDLFRVVHDMVAHVRGGYSFSTNGEYNGMLTHASTLPEAAWPALFAETFGQNAVYEKTKQYAPQNAYASRVGPEIIRSELKKRTKASRSKKSDGDEPLGYQHLKTRPWLMKDAVSQRAFCPNGEGGGVTNSCGSEGALGAWAAASFSSMVKTKRLPEGLENVSSLKISTDSLPDVKRVADSMGVDTPAQLVTLGACNIEEADVSVSLYHEAALKITAKVPVGDDGTVRVDTTLHSGDDLPWISYDMLSLDTKARMEAKKDDAIQPRVASRLMDVMLKSMEEAERLGFSHAETTAAGYGSKLLDGRQSSMQGYRLWGKFGFDGDIPSRWLRDTLDEGIDVGQMLRPEDKQHLARTGTLRLQQLLATKEGEALWKDWGTAIVLKFDFTDTSSLGYQRYERLKSLAKRAKQKRSLFFEYVAGLEVREDPSLWSGFVETRDADCGRDDDGRFASGNKCGGLVDMPKEDPRGRLRYDNGVQTDAARKLYQIGTSEKKLRGLVEAMGGDPMRTTVDINPPSVNISVADKDGSKLFHVDVENGRARLYPTKDLNGKDVARIRNAAREAFPSEYADKNASFRITVYRKADDIKKWQAENDKKIKKWEDKYAFSTLLPPHRRPKKWERSIDARHASLLAFAQARAFCPTGEGGGVKNDCSSKDGGGDVPQWHSAESLGKDFPREYWTESDKKESYSIVDTAAGKVPVLDRRDTSTPDYLDEIECHGEECGLGVTFDDAKELQGDNSSSPYKADIAPDWSPLDAYIGKGFGYFTGNATDGGDSIDFHGVDYGTIDEGMASELIAEKQKEAKEEWESMSDEEKDLASMKLLYGVSEPPGEEDDKTFLREAKTFLREAGEKEWLSKKDYEIQDEVQSMRESARESAVEQMKHDLESALAYETLDCCLQLYRGMRVDDREAEKILRGGYVTHDAVNSWTTSRGTARSFGGNKLLLVVRRPRVGYVFAPNTHDEAEVVRPPSKMKITGAVKTKSGLVFYVDEDEDYIQMHGAHA